MEEPALFLRDGDAFVGTVLIQGGWDPNAANGGMVLALLGHCLEEVPTLVPMSVSRVTADLVRPVPIGRRLHVESTVLREGKKIQVVGLQLLVDGVEHVRASVLRLREADLTGEDLQPSTTTSRPADVLRRPEESRSHRESSFRLPGFLEAVDMRRADTVDGSTSGCWLRLEVPVVAGEPVRATSRMAFAFDFANLIGVEGHSESVTMINPDVTAQVLRPPRGEWIAVTGETRFEPTIGRGISMASLSDDDGLFAVATVSQLLQVR